MNIRTHPSNQNYRDNFKDNFQDKKLRDYPWICIDCRHRQEITLYPWCSLLAVRLDRVIGIDRDCGKYQKKEE